MLALTVFLFIFRLGGFTFFDGDEPKYAQVTREMIRTGDWATLHYNQEAWFDKPPLFYWIAVLFAFIRGGLNEFSMRLVAALAGLLTVFTTYKLGKELFGEKVGIVAGFILPVGLQFILQSRICVLDTLLILFLTLSMFYFYQFYEKRKNIYLYGLYASVGLAVLTKGIVGMLLPGCAIFFFILFRKEWKLILKLLNPLGIFIFLAITAPWHIVEWQRHGDRFLYLVFGFLFASRFSVAVDNQRGGWYYYFPSLLLGFYPFSFLIPYSFIKALKKWSQKEYLLILCFIIPNFIVISSAVTKLPNYAFPMFPFLAILIAKFWIDFVNAEDKKPYKWGLIASYLLFIFSGALFTIGLLLLGKQFPETLKVLIPQVRLIAYTFAGFSILHLIFFLKRKYKLAFASLIFMSVVVVLILIMSALPTLEKFKTSPPLGKLVQSLTQPDEVVGAYKLQIRPSVVYYPNRPTAWLESEEALFDFIGQPKKAYFFVAKNEYEPIKGKLKGKTKIVKETWDLLLLSNKK